MTSTKVVRVEPPDNMKTAPRVDSASRLIQASPADIYRAFAEPGAMEQWLPPGDMVGRMLHFDFRDGGSYRMRLLCHATGMRSSLENLALFVEEIAG